MRFKTRYVLWLVLLSVLVSSCMVPLGSTLGPNQNSSTKLPIQKAAFQTQSNSAEQPEMITFPDMVEKQSLSVVDKTPNTSAGLSNPGQHYTLNLVTDTPDSGSIKIPATGSFQIILEGGDDQVQVLDNDATDGVGRARLPAKLLDGYIQARGTPNMTLNYDDPLYHVRQDLVHANNPQGKPVWHQIGKRPFPIPQNWYNETPYYTLKFTNNGATNISTRWYPTDNAAKPDYPVGVKEICSEGGIVELPGVAKLDIPAGAIPNCTVVRITQILEAPDRANPPWNGETFNPKLGDDFISPVIKIEPMPLELARPAFLDLPLLEEGYKNAQGITILQTYDLTEMYDVSFYLKKFHVVEPFEIKLFTYYAKLITHG